MSDAPPTRVDYTKIIATVGPACQSVDTLRAMIRAGADCFRVNFSHGDGPSLQPLMDAVRAAARAEDVPVAIIGDIQGPKLRIGTVPDSGVLLVEGESVVLTPREVAGSEREVHTRYAELAKDVEPGARVLLSDGTIELSVERIDGPDVVCRVVTGGRLYSNKGLNLPGRTVSVHTLTEKDRRDLEFLAGTDVDLIAISFVRSSADLDQARDILGEAKIPLIAKLERFEALDNLEEILDASDGIMVARGDLGVELPFEQVPVLQKRILTRATRRGRWAIVATQMLGSMVRARRPTRAEASDVLNAVLDGADAVMLSEETAVGDNPVRAVEAMSALTATAEELHHRRDPHEPGTDEGRGFAAAAAGAAVSAADRVQARAVVCLAGSGLTALRVSKWHPDLPIIALSSTGGTLRRLNCLRGVRPVAIHRHADVESQLVAADHFLLEVGWATPGDVVVVVAAIPLGMGKETNTIRFHRVREVGSKPTWIPAKPDSEASG